MCIPSPCTLPSSVCSCGVLGFCSEGVMAWLGLVCLLTPFIPCMGPSLGGGDDDEKGGDQGTHSPFKRKLLFGK